MSSMVAILALAAASAGPNPDYGRPAPPPQQVQAPEAAAVPGERKLNLSKAAKKAITELKAAVDAHDAANFPAKLAAAQAVAQTSDEKYFVAQLQLKAAADSKNEAAIKAGIEAMLASGGVDQARSVPLYLNLGKIDYKSQQFAQAATSFERILATDPANSDALVLLAETRKSQGRASDAAALLQRAIQAKSAAGQKADEAWYKRAVAIAYEGQLPAAIDLSRQWVAAYPTPANWRDAIRIYRKIGNPDGAATLDALRLSRATASLSGETDFQNFAAAATIGSTPGEARAVIDEAIAAKQVDPNKPLIKDIVATLRANRAMSQADLPNLAKEALAGSTARLVVRTADAYYGYGDYARAAELYRAALTKSGADANLVNLHLGMALARAGDKVGATAALNAVTGPRAELAKFWLVYAATRA